MLRNGSPSTRRAGQSPASPAAKLRAEIAALKQRIARYAGHKPPKHLAGRACQIRLRELTTKLLLAEMREERKVRRAS